MPFCAACFEKQRTIDELTEENRRLKAQLNYRQRQATEGFFGSATPSSKKPVKSNAETEKRSKKGGGKIGHKGHGRSSLSEAEADRVERIPVDELCPECGAPLEYKGTKNRSVADCAPVKMQKILYKLEVGRCPRCRKKIAPLMMRCCWSPSPRPPRRHPNSNCYECMSLSASGSRTAMRKGAAKMNSEIFLT